MSRQVNTSRLSVSSGVFAEDALRRCRSMWDLSRSLLLATAAILCMTIRASPLHDISLASPNSITDTTAANGRAVTCSRAYASGADIMTCLSLLLSLPETTQDGAFHTDGFPDIYKLPEYYRGTNCEIGVVLKPGIGEFSNWPSIRFAANQIIATCSRREYPYGTNLGTASMGLHGNIQLWVGPAHLGVT